MATETIADLYLRQGHVADALRIYDVLLARAAGGSQEAMRLAGKIAGAASGAGASHSDDPREALLRELLTRIACARREGAARR